MSQIVVAGGGTIQYSYANGKLSSVQQLDGTTSTFTWESPTVGTTQTILFWYDRLTIFDPAAEGAHRHKEVYLTPHGTYYQQNGFLNQATQLVRMVSDGNDEVVYGATNQIPYMIIYEGAGSLKVVERASSVRHYKDGWAFVPNPPDEMYGEFGVTMANLVLDAGLRYQNTSYPNSMEGKPNVIIDEEGVSKTLQYAGNEISKITYGDGTFETWAYNTRNQVTRHRDRLGSVTKNTYDAAGHLITKEVGILEVTTTTTSGGGGEDPYGNGGDPYGGMYSGGMYPGGMPGYGGGSTTTTTSDVNQPEYAVYRWEYFPAGHPSAGLLKTEFDPLWDGSSADTHRTDQEYNIFGNLTKKLGPAAVAGQTRPETVYTYDAFSRLHTVVDPEGHTVEYQYDAIGRRIRTIYDDSTTEETLYGAAGSGNEGLVVKTKDRRNVVSTMTYDAAGRVTQTITGGAFDANILDGQPDDTPITDRNQKSIVQMGYEPGSQNPAVVIRDGARTDRIFDYRGRVVETQSYPYAGKTLVSKTKYLNNRKLYDEDPYGRRKYQAYRASDGVMVRHVVEAYPGVVDAVMAANDNTPQYTAGYNAGYSVGYEEGFFGGYMYYYGYGNPPNPSGTAAYVKGYLDAHGDGLGDGFADAMDEMYGGMYGGSGGSGPVGYHGNYWMDSHGRSFSVPPVEQNAVLMALMRDTNLNPNYTVKDAIQDPGGRVWQVVDERSTLTESTFDTRGQPVIQLAAKGTPVEAKTETVFDAAGNAVEIRSPRYFDANDLNGFEKCRTVMTYDGANRVLTRTEAPGTAEVGTESYAYDLSGRVKARVDARGKEWTTTYASCCGHSVSSKNPLGHGSITNQNAGGLTVHTAGVEDVAGHNSLLNPDDAKTLQETTTIYDALGRSIASTVWLQPLGLLDVSNPPIAGFGGVAGTQGLTTQTLYDADLTDNSGLETTTGIAVTNPLGGTYTVSLSAAIAKLGEPIAQGGAGITFAAGTPGSAVVKLNAENEISFSIRDALGRSLMSGILHPHDAAAPNLPGSLLTWNCQVPDTVVAAAGLPTEPLVLESISVDALGNTTKSRSNGLGQTVQSVDQAGNISTVQYDAGGNAIVSRDPNNVGQDCVFDALGRRTQCTDTVASVTKTGYDKSGQQISATDAKNKTTYYVFDARDRRRRETDRLSYPTEWEYDAVGNLLPLKDAENQITAYGYNDAGLRITEQYPDHVTGAIIGQAGSGIITFGYDALGRRTSKQDQQGDIMINEFDMAGFLLARSYAGHASGPLAGQSNTDSFAYDRAGRMLSAVKGRYNNTITFSYDDRGQQIQETLTTHGQTYTVGYVKNVLGQTTQLQYPDGSLVDRAHTIRVQLQAVTYTPLNAALSPVATFNYDAGGRETARHLGNGLTTTSSYFADNQIHSIATPTVETLTYTYDPNKNPTSETRSGVMAPYSWTTGSAGYDHEDRLTNRSRANGDSQTWNLSPVHDWTSTTINGAVQNRTHGPAHELITMSGAQVNNSLQALSYDTKGNMTTDDRGCGMSWDFDNMLTEFEANGVNELKDATYEYDAIGRRVAKNVAQMGGSIATTLFIQAGHQIIAEYASATAPTIIQRTLIFGAYIDDLLYTQKAEGITYPHKDLRYSIFSTTNSIGIVDAFFSYSATGSRTQHSSSGFVQSSSNCLPESFTGRLEESESGILFFRSRYISASSGRFLSRDKLTYIDGRNVYAGYFLYSGVDPYGFQLGLAVPRIVPRIGIRPPLKIFEPAPPLPPVYRPPLLPPVVGPPPPWPRPLEPKPQPVDPNDHKGVGPQSEPWKCPGSARNGNDSDCTRRQLEIWDEIIKTLCNDKKSGTQYPGCSNINSVTWSCSEIEDLKKKWDDCANARRKREHNCFRGGDAHHQYMIAGAEYQVSYCNYLLRYWECEGYRNSYLPPHMWA